jgi:predicted metalloprotease
MKWRRGRGADQIEDLRGRPSRGGGGLPFPIPTGRGGKAGLGGLGIIGIIIVILLTSGVLGGGGGGFGIPDIQALPTTPAAQGGDVLTTGPAPTDELGQFMGFVMEDVQDSWARTFAEAGRQYEPTRLRLFTEAIDSGCGPASAATGPFYCPPDRRVYLDLGFFQELQSRFGAPGDFAQAYVIAHEVGHHVQTILGINDDVRRAQAENPDEANELSVRLELQADCFAGVWAHSAFEEGLLDKGDLEEGLGAAAAVGDDRIQAQTQGRIDPESWTHGSAEQRTTWFQKGFDSGDPNACETFSGDI